MPRAYPVRFGDFERAEANSLIGWNLPDWVRGVRDPRSKRRCRAYSRVSPYENARRRHMSGGGRCFREVEIGVGNSRMGKLRTLWLEVSVFEDQSKTRRAGLIVRCTLMAALAERPPSPLDPASVSPNRTPAPHQADPSRPPARASPRRSCLVGTSLIRAVRGRRVNALCMRGWPREPHVQ